MWRSCSIFSMISLTFSVIGRPARGAFLTSKFSSMESSEPFTGYFFWYYNRSLNIIDFCSFLRRIFPFFEIKFQNVSNFFLIFTHFKNTITFDRTNEFQFFFFNLFSKISFMDRTVRSTISFVLPEIYDIITINWRKRHELFSLPNIWRIISELC